MERVPHVPTVLLPVEHPRPEPSAYHWQPWHEDRWLCETQSGSLYIVGADGCSCAEWHQHCQGTDRRCCHQSALGYSLISQGSALTLLGLELLEEEPATGGHHGC
jgi:hypothetical protein